MDKQSKLEDKVKKLRRYSCLFEPMVHFKKVGKIRHSISDPLDTNLSKIEKFDKIVKDIISEPNLNKDELNKSLKRRKSYLAKDVSVGDQVSPKLVNVDLLKKKLENEMKPLLRLKKCDNNNSPKIVSEVKHAKKSKIKRTSSSTSEKSVSSKEGTGKPNITTQSVKYSEKDEISSKHEEHIGHTKKTKKDLKSVKKILVKTESEEKQKIDLPELVIKKEEPIDPDILKIYTDKTIKKFSNLETIFESPVGSLIMGKRKLRRYLNFDDINGSIKKARRKAKIRKINPNLKMKTRSIKNNVEDLIKAE